MRSTYFLCLAVIFLFVGEVPAHYGVDYEEPLHQYEDPYKVTSKHDYYLYNADVPDPVKPAQREKLDYNSLTGTGYSVVFSHGVEDQTEVKSPDQELSKDDFVKKMEQYYPSNPKEYHHYKDYKK
uniref:Uncharacterized protein n=1 Tax=Phlebotomus papatasi TaxID=29031 RepID=A0A1B0DN94_PHLPP